jgi:hypothetical protein
MSKQLKKGFRVKILKVLNAGIVSLEEIHYFSPRITFRVNSGSPYEVALREAEMLAVTIDAELVVGSEIERYSKSAEYYIEEEKEGDL